MASVSKSVAFSSIATFGSLAISLALVVAVSRILPPAVIGSYVVAFSLIMLIEPVRELQLKSYVVLQPVIDRDAMGPVRFVSFLLSGLALAAAAVAAAIVYRSFRTEAVGNCLVLMACGFLFKAWTSPAQGILQSERRFRALAVVTLAAALAKAVITLVLVFRGWGAEALAIGQLTEFILEMSVVGLVNREIRWAPARAAGARDILRFCSQFGGAQLAGQMSAALDGVLIGAFQGLAPAAIYNRGNRIIRIFRSGIEGAILPIALTEFAAAEGDRNRLREKYLVALGALTGLSWPALAAAIVLAGPLILGLFGPNWGEAVHLAQILAVGAIIHAASALSQQVHVSVGEAKLLLKRESYLSALRIALLVITATISVEAVAYGFVAMLAMSFVVNQGLLRRSFAITAGDFLRATWKSAAVALIVGGAAWAALQWRPSQMGDALALMVFGSLSAAVWAIGLFALRHALYAEVVRIVGRRLAQRTIRAEEL